MLGGRPSMNYHAFSIYVYVCGCDIKDEAPHMANLRQQFLNKFDLRRVGSGSSKEVYCRDTELDKVTVMFSKDIDAQDAFAEALLECFWSHFLYHNNILPHNPEWCVHLYTAEQQQKSILRSRELSAELGDNADQFARELEAEAIGSVKQYTHSTDLLVYCTTARASCDMHQWCETHHPTTDAVLYVLQQITEQLTAMHALRVVHGDVKCNNVLILDKQTGLAQLCDFTLSNKETLVKPLHTREDCRWLHRKGGTYQMNLRCIEETPLQYGIRNDWLALCLVSVKVRALVDAHDQTRFLQIAYNIEKKFWHTARATVKDYRQLKRLVYAMTAAATDELTKAASEIACLALQRAKPPKQAVSTSTANI